MNNINDLVKNVYEKQPKRVLLQLPEGLKSKAMEIASALEEIGIEVVISGDSCYGACDLQEQEAKQMNCDLLVHVGHSRFSKTRDMSVPVLYYPWEIDVKIKEKELRKIKEDSVAIATTVQHLKSLKVAKTKLEKLGKRIEVLGQVLGCSDYVAGKKSESVLFIGSGLFHPTNTNLRGKVYRYDVERGKVEDVTELCKKQERKRQARLALVKDAETVCIVVSTKSGQFLLDYQKIAKKLRKKHKKVFTLVMNEVRNPEELGIKADIFINTACPRLVEDFSKFVNADDV
jgi:2-(3-amino-3-carboxypropyl)histidine synthase